MCKFNLTIRALRAGITADLDAAREMFKHVDDRTKVMLFAAVGYLPIQTAAIIIVIIVSRIIISLAIP